MIEAQVKHRRGCLFYGCLTSGVLLLFMLMGLLLGLRHFKNVVNVFTDSKPMLLPAREYSPAQTKELDQRVEAFMAAIQAHRSTAPLALSADDLNALAATRPELQALRDKFHLIIEGDKAKTQVSLPMAELGLPFFRGRYLNGTADLDLSFQDGKLTVSARNLSAKGASLPAVYEQRVRQQNLAAHLNADQHVATALSQIQSVEIKDGKLVIVPKPGAPAPP
jgi:hypothetical protein